MGVAVFDTLAVSSTPEDDQWLPYLAESFTPNDDFTVWTMDAPRWRVTFHDGTPLDAAAIAVNFGTVLAGSTRGPGRAPVLQPREPHRRSSMSSRCSTTCRDRTPTGQPANPASSAWSHHQHGSRLHSPTRPLNQAPVGTGPFVFDSRNEDSVTRFVRNESWWNGDVYLDAVEFVTVTDPDTRNDLLLQGEIQALQTTNPASIDDLKNTDGIQNLLDDSGDESFIMMNSTATPFDDIRARKALTFATPRQNYIDLIGLGISQPANQMFTPSSPYYNPAVQQEADQPELVGDLVDSYCGDFPDNCTDGKIDMEFQWSGPSVVQTRIAELLDEGWSIGFNVELPGTSSGCSHPGSRLRRLRRCDLAPIRCAESRPTTVSGLRMRHHWWPVAELATFLRPRLAMHSSTTSAWPPRSKSASRFSLELSEKVHAGLPLRVHCCTRCGTIPSAENVRGMCGHVTPRRRVDMRCVLNGRTWLSNVWFAE